MGQKISPYGLRIGLNRKWNISWIGVGKEKKRIFYQQIFIEELFKSFLYFYSYRKPSITKRFLLVQIKIYKFGPFRNFIFVFCYKMRTKKRKNFSSKFYKRFNWTKLLKHKKSRKKSYKIDNKIKNKVSKIVATLKKNLRVYNKKKFKYIVSLNKKKIKKKKNKIKC